MDLPGFALSSREKFPESPEACREKFVVVKDVERGYEAEEIYPARSQIWRVPFSILHSQVLLTSETPDLGRLVGNNQQKKERQSRCAHMRLDTC